MPPLHDSQLHEVTLRNQLKICTSDFFMGKSQSHFFFGKLRGKNTMIICTNSNFSPPRLDQSNIWVTGGMSGCRPEQSHMREGWARRPRNNCHKTSWRIFRPVHWQRHIKLPVELFYAACKCKLGWKFKFLYAYLSEFASIFSRHHNSLGTSRWWPSWCRASMHCGFSLICDLLYEKEGKKEKKKEGKKLGYNLFLIRALKLDKVAKKAFIRQIFFTVHDRSPEHFPLLIFPGLHWLKV